MNSHPMISPSWEPVGYDDEPGGERSRLLTRIYVHGTPMHLEAVEVHKLHGSQRAINPAYDELLDHATEINGDGPFQTTEILGRHYVLIATSFS